MSILPRDFSRCAGEGHAENGEMNWREGSEDCLRRTAPGGEQHMEPPVLIVFECPYRIAP